MEKTRLSRLLEERAKLDARIRDMQAREREEERKRDTRRKIIAGALALEHAAIDPDGFGAALRELLEKHVNRAADRALFDLPPRSRNDRAASSGSEQNGTSPPAGLSAKFN